MADDDNNDHDDNADEAEGDHFEYHPDLSTTCIFLRTSTTTTNSMLRWRHHPRHDLRPSCPSPTSVFSSSCGLLLCHQHNPSNSISTYHVGNPFLEVPYLTLSPSGPHPPDTHAVLSGRYDGIFLIICLVPNPTQEGNLYYSLDAYSSSRGCWLPALSHWNHILDDDVNRMVIPNSGISCGRGGYWLTWLPASRSSVSVLRVDPKSLIKPANYPLLTYLKIPANIPDDGVGIVMKLGRLGNKVGLVVVNEIQSRVELYLMRELGRTNGNEHEDDKVMVDWVQYPGCLMVDVDPMMEEGAVEVVGPNQIKCREMPRPMRFESFKMEVLLSAGGGRRIVVWENSRIDFARTQVTVVDAMVSDRNAPYLERGNGIPHISTSVVPSDSSSVPPA